MDALLAKFREDGLDRQRIAAIADELDAEDWLYNTAVRAFTGVSTDGPVVRSTLQIGILVAGTSEMGQSTLVEKLSEVYLGYTDTLAGQQRSVTLHCGCFELPNGLTVNLFGGPLGFEERPLWERLSWGALGAVLLVDCCHLQDSFPVIDFFETRGIPFVVVVYQSEEQAPYTLEEIKDALAVADDVPVVRCDLRSPKSCADSLISLVKLVMTRRQSAQAELPLPDAMPTVGEPAQRVSLDDEPVQTVSLEDELALWAERLDIALAACSE
ncbi:hypothetical protein ACLQ2P_31540 [Actinomadura citrea]|uniref:hypothetical protein n=1 Tax=Actinomadura citrea TaxID=46158 RepID=UPI003CE4CFE7